MEREAVRAARLRAHLLTEPTGTVVEAARWMTATQAQELWGGKYALAVRASGTPTARDVDAAFDAGEIVRTWPMRGTLHIMAADDVGWMLPITADRVFRSAAGRHRQLGLDADDFAHGERILRRVLAGGGLSRAEVFTAFESDGLDPAGQRGAHLLLALAIRGVAHWGATIPREDGAASHQLFTLNDDLPSQRATPEDPPAELFRRYLRGHGPATAEDFAWWSGLTLTDARRAAAESGATEVDDGMFALARPDVGTIETGGPLRALASFEEYYISYADRSVAADEAAREAVGPGRNGMVRPILVRDGQIIGTWTRGGVVTIFDGATPDAGDVLAAYRDHADG